MTTAIKRRRGTTTQHSSFTGLEGELTVDTTKDTVVVHDGSTAGGFPLLREDLNNNTNVLTTSNSKTLTNKTINLTDNTLSGTLAQFNTAVSDADLVSIAGSETLTNKTLTSPNINTATISGGTINNAVIGGSQAAAATVTNLTASGTVNFSGATISNLGTITTADINGGTIDGTSIGSSSASTGAFTTLSASSTVSGTGFSTYLASPPAIGGTTAAAGKFTTLEATGVTTVSAGTVSAPAITTTGDTNTGIYFPAADTIAFAEGGAEAMRIDSSGRLLINTTTARTTLDGDRSALVQIEGLSVDQGMSMFRNENGAFGPTFWIGKSRGTTAGSNTIVQNGDGLGSILFLGSDGTKPVQSALIAAYVDGTPGTNDMPGRLVFFTTADGASSVSERMRIDSSGNVGIGTSSPSYKLDVSGIIRANSGYFRSTNTYTVFTGADILGTTGGMTSIGANPIVFGTDGTERMRIDSSGNVGIGTTSPAANLEVKKTTDNAKLQVTSSYEAALWLANGGGSEVSVINASGSNILSLRTSNTERMRINSAGEVLIGRTTDSDNAGVTIDGIGFGRFNRSGGVVQVINRLTNDGTLISFRQDSTEEGTISVSGTTVSYNGGHLSRYAQTQAAKDDTLLKGTVLSNLDEMNVYTDAEGNSVDNEQLNKVKVSDVDGDVNVAGVFVNWSYDEQHQVDEINMAMTGDMIIRIAQGVVVQKGDLLMSAGDGTAKPQGDDIVRSKTVAKVTSNHVTCTYADGSYCVPCVLMAC